MIVTILNIFVTQSKLSMHGRYLELDKKLF